MKKYYTLLLPLIFLACNEPPKQQVDKEILSSLGKKYNIEFSELADSYRSKIEDDSSSLDAYIGYAESHILLYVFGYVPRSETVPEAKRALIVVQQIDSLNTQTLKLAGILSFLDWKWDESKAYFEQSIQQDPKNLSARHWYSLWYSAMGDFENAMSQSDTIMTMDERDEYLVGRSSLLYFQYRFEEMKPLMEKSIKQHPELPWAYDWLGMAYNGLEEHNDALKTYFKAFELSDGTVEVTAGLGHALAHAGETEMAKQIADYYVIAAKDHYLPPVQRSFVHLGLSEYDTAIELLEQAYQEHSWFLIFMQTEHWYDPLREDTRFINIMNRMEFPKDDNKTK